MNYHSKTAAHQEIKKDPDGLTLLIPLHIKYGQKSKVRKPKGKKEKPSPNEIKAWLEFMNTIPL